WPVLLLLVLLGGAVAGGIYWWTHRTPTAAGRTVGVLESSGEGGGSRTLLNASGYVTARRIATVSSKVSGKVMEVLVEEGMKVEAGQILGEPLFFHAAN